MQDVGQELDKRVDCRVWTTSIGTHDGIFRSEIERFSDVFDGVRRGTIELIEANYERDVALFEEIDRIEAFIETASIHQDKRTECARSDVFPHEAESVLAWRTKT